MNEQFYTKILKNSPIGFSLCEIISDSNNKQKDFRFIDVNSEFENIMGLRTSDIIGKSARDINSEGIVKYFDELDKLTDLVLAGTSYEFYYFSNILNSWYKGEVFSPANDFLVTFFIDINKKKEIENKLVKKTEQLEEFLDVSAELLSIIDVDSRFIMVNEAWKTILGYTLEELTSIKFLELVHPEDMENTIKAICKIEEEERITDFINRYRCKDGSYKHIEWRVHPKGKLKYAAATDITNELIIEKKRKQAESLLYDTNIRLLELAEHSKTVAWETDQNGLYTYVSEVSKSVLGYSPEELVGKFHFYELHPLEGREEFKNNALKAFSAKISFNGLINPLVTKDGTRIWASTYGFPVLNEDGSLIGYKGSDMDVTERIEMEESIKKLNQQMLQSLEEQVEIRTAEYKAAMSQLMERERMASLGSLVSGVAHEINTPLGIGVTTASYIEKLNNENRKLLTEGKMSKNGLLQFMDSINESIVILNHNLFRASELIKNFKQIAVNQSGELQVNFKFIDNINSVLISLKHEYKNKDYIIDIECPEDLVIYSYPGAISQILTNLIMNTLTHGFKGKDKGSIKIQVSKENDNIKFVYSDDGLGISPDHINRIYDPFFTTNREYGGSGLGMNIIYNIVTTKLNGTIQCISEVNNGATFIIEFPIANNGGNND